MTAARLTVDLAALRGNYRRIAASAWRAGNPLPAAVVKADAYGLGAVPVVQALRAEGCRHYFVANVAEGVALRAAELRSGIDLYVFSGPLDQGDAHTMVKHDLVPVLNDARQVALWRTHRAHPAAVHVDTGMHRLGFPSGDVDAALFAGLDIRLLLSHFANADDPDDAMNTRQEGRFRAVAARFPSTPTSLGNSASALAGMGIGMARAGVALYGGNPFAQRRHAMAVVASLEARVLALRDVAAGEPLGYGGAHTTAQPIRLAVLGIGYADGLPRAFTAGEVAFGGVRLPVLGRVSMDLVQVDATAVQGDMGLGDWVEVFGPTIGLDEFAARIGTISHDALTRIGPRVGRRHIGLATGAREEHFSSAS